MPSSSSSDSEDETEKKELTTSSTIKMTEIIGEKSNPSKKNRSLIERNGISHRYRWAREMLAELVGTYLLVMIGDCAVANYVLDKKSDHFAIAFAFGIAGMAAIAASSPISGSHLNPAVTVAFALINKLPYRKIPHYLLGQYLGAFLAAVTVYLTYFDAIYANDHGHRIATPEQSKNNSFLSFVPTPTGGIFSTYPAPWMSLHGTLIDQTIATFTLVFCVMAVTNSKAKLPSYLHPFMLGMTISGCVIAFGLNCGAALNPARDLSPRVFQFLAGYGVEVFKPTNGLYWLTAGILGPHIGGIIGAVSYKYLLLYDDDDEQDNNNAKTGQVSQNPKSQSFREGEAA